MEILALSSGESELGAMVKACSEGLGLKALLADFQINVNIKILSDSTAALGMVKRLGLGRVRHLAVSDLWVQQHVRKGSFTVAKYPGANNTADLMTKYKNREELTRLMGLLGFGILSGRSAIAPTRTTGWNVAQAVSSPTANHASLNGVDSEPTLSSNIIRHYQSACTILEERRLAPSGPLPDPSTRVLYSVLDLNTGDEVYACGQGVDDKEPDVSNFVQGQARPSLLLHWILVNH